MHAWRFGNRLRRMSPLLGAAGLITVGDVVNGGSREGEAKCKGQRDDGREKGPGFLGVFLDANSIEKLKALKGEAWVDGYPHAVIHLHPDPSAQASFRPLCGAKAEVKVKGIAEDKATRQRILVVDVRVGSGLIKAEPFVPTISFGSEKWGGDVSDLLGADLARRLKDEGVLTSDRASWNGQLPPQTLDGVRYHPTEATFTKVSDVVLSGTLCTSTEYNIKRLQCIPGGGVQADEDDEEQGDEDDDDEDEEEDGEEEVAGECPLCTYMMASPCRDVFTVFKACIDKAEGTDEKEDLQACEESATLVHACIVKHRLFSKPDDEEGEDEEEEGGDKGEARG